MKDQAPKDPYNGHNGGMPDSMSVRHRTGEVAPRRSILFELTRLAAVVALPLLGVIAFLLVDMARRDREHATDDARRLSDQTAARSERFLADFRATLEAVARRPLVQAMDAAHCDPALPTLRELYPRAGNILVVDLEGWILCGAKPPPSGERLRIIDLELHRAVIRDGEFRLSRPLVGLISKTWAVTAVQPVRGSDSRVVGMVGMAIDLRLLQAFGSLEGKHTDVVAGIIAGPGVVIAHSVEPERWIGKDVSADAAIATMLDRKEGTLRAAGLDGHDRLWAFRPVAGTDWIAYAGVAAEAAMAPARDRAFGALLLVLAIVSVMIAAATYTARRIAQPVRAIADVARARTGGALDARAPLEGPQEVTEVAAAFNTMVEAQLSVAQAREIAQTKLQLQLNRMNLLHRITSAIGERQDLRSIFQVVIRSLEDDLPIDFGCICLYDAAEQVAVMTSVGARSAALVSDLAGQGEVRIALEQNGLSPCVQGQLVYEPDIEQTPFPFPQRLARAGLRALVVAPLVAESKVFGVLVAARTQASSFTSNECEFLRQLSEHVALAAHQAQLYTALQQAYDDLRRSQQTVMQQERLRALGQMASGVAHDINNSISPIALYTESLLEREPSLTDRARSYLSIIQRAIEDVAQTVSRMREFYRPRERQAALTLVALNQIAPQVIDLTRVRWRDLPQQKGVVIEIRTDLHSPLPAILGEESEIRDALTNLVFNAIDAMPQGGVLTVRTGIAIEPEGSQRAPDIYLEVSDSGMGMDEETRRHCLEPFFTTKGERGTGLGLAMVYGMVQRHGAELAIDSTPGQGTAVRISFPAPIAAAASSQSAVYEPALRPLSILIVDDDPLILESMRATLVSDGHRVTAADGGRAGIESFTATHNRNEQFDAVITDLGMPSIDGRQVAAAVKAISPSTPVILITGWGQRLVDDGEVPAHVDRVLNKPPRLRELRAALRELARG